MKTRISALMDGELESHERAEALRALRRSSELRGDWCDYHLVGAALRGERGLELDVTARVMAALEQEPTVLAPRPRTADWRRPALALAASAAGVAVVGWLAVQPADDASRRPAANMARLEARPAATVQPAATPRLQEYLVAHQAYAPAGAAVGARNIRTVAVSGERR